MKLMVDVACLVIVAFGLSIAVLLSWVMVERIFSRDWAFILGLTACVATLPVLARLFF